MNVAVVGSGPAGIYAAHALAERGVLVDVIEALPAPFGLGRYGVAPDHPKIKSICQTLDAMLEPDEVRFIGNAEVGRDVSVAELLDRYDAVVLSFGAADDRRMGIPGEDLPGSIAATNLVRWYSGHPDEPIDAYAFDSRDVVVVGAGNVALDVTRVLARSVDELRPTDVPEHVLDALGKSQVRDLHIVARRGPAQAKWTTKELREIGELAGVDTIVEAADLVLDPASEEAIAASPVARRNMDVMRGWAERPPTGAGRRIHFHFYLRPAEITGSERVEGVQFERTQVGPDGRASGTGELVTIPAQTVYRSIGYHGRPIAGLPFDEASGTIPNDAGRVLQGSDPIPGLYVAGWIKRGPTGVIGTNKRDASETVVSLLADLGVGEGEHATSGADARVPLPELLAERGVPAVLWPGWRRIVDAELALGASLGRGTVKIVDRDDLLRAAGAS